MSTKRQLREARRRKSVKSINPLRSARRSALWIVVLLIAGFGIVLLADLLT